MALFRRDSPAPAHSVTFTGPSGEPGGGTRIAPGARFEGKITGTVDLVVDGEVIGEIAVSAVVLIGPQGSVTGPISARVVRVAGRVAGDLRGAERVEITATANLEGDIAAPRVTIAEGAFFKGRVEMKPAPGSEPAAGGKTPPTPNSTDRAHDGRPTKPPEGPRNG
ncbi:MAG: polymer-forming cytoskeletal protein [Acidobacteriota bacterium]